MDEIESQSTTFLLLDGSSEKNILEQLVGMGVCSSGESILEVCKAGEGNMNLVLRVRTQERTVILKQSRPWVEKYPTIAAPEERILAEIHFYRLVSNATDVGGAMPKVLAADARRRVLVLEDLGQATDYSSLYGIQTSSRDEVNSVFEAATQWLTHLHAIPLEQPNDFPKTVGCHSLRELNCQHVFTIPLLNPPAIDLDQVCDGLSHASRRICEDQAVHQTMKNLGQRYLREGGHLLHGDYYPGSWLNTNVGFRVIDPEFCFAGPPEFDLGVLAAHWIFCGGEASIQSIHRISDLYGKPISKDLVCGFAGAELIRRLIGVAQLPLSADLEQRIHWLQCGHRFLNEMYGNSHAVVS